MRLCALCLVAVLFVHAGCASRQAGRVPALLEGSADNSEDAEYEPIPVDLFPGLEKANLIVDYYYTSGISLGDRFKYEIIVADNNLRLVFQSPGTEDFKKVEFSATRELTALQVRELTRVIKAAQLVQLRPAIPRPRFTGHTREVLIVRSATSSVAGGRFNSNIFGDGTRRDMEQQIAREKAKTTTLGGNVDSVIRAMEKLFTELPRLLSQAYGR